MTLTFPITKPTIDEIRDAIGQIATFIIASSGIACTASGCSLDPINNISANPFCTTCHGYYWLNGETTVSAMAHVRWTTMDALTYPAGGQILDGDLTVTIAIDEMTSNQAIQVKRIYVDNREVFPNRVVYRGVPTRNRIRFVCNMVQRA